MTRPIFEKLTERLAATGGQPRQTRRLKTALFCVVFVPLAAASVYAVQDLYGDLTREAVRRQADVATVAASLADERVADLTDAAGIIASQAVVVEAMTRGDWQRAAELAAQHRENTALAGQLVLTDQRGSVRASAGRPEDAGKDLSGESWFKEVSAAWSPAVSAAEERSGQTARVVLTVAIPLRAADGRLLGALAAQADPDALFGGLRDVLSASGSDLYVIDSAARLILRPVRLAGQTVPDVSRLPFVQDAVRGGSGSISATDPFSGASGLIDYRPVGHFGWAMIVSEPAGTAFSDRTHDVAVFTLAYLLFFAADGLIIYLLLTVLVAMIAARRREAALLESLADGVAAMDTGRLVTAWNRSAETLTGWPAAEALGKPAKDLLRFVRERDRRDNSSFIEECLTQRKPRTMEERAVLIRRDGGEMPVGAAAAPVLEEGGRLAGLIVVFRDLTGERHSQLVRSDLAYASHQLRTPVTEASWSIEMAKEEKDPAAKQAKIAVAEHALLSVRKLAEEIVDVSRLDQQMEIPRIEAVDAKAIMTQAVEAAAAKAESRRAKITAAAAPDAPFRTDPRILSRVLAELLDNALEYGGEGAKIGLSAAAHENGLLFEVADDGPGIPAAEQPLVFTKFFRGSNVPPDSAGAGLGLYICRSYARLLEGRIWFESEPGKGTTFRLYVPSAK